MSKKIVRFVFTALAVMATVASFATQTCGVHWQWGNPSPTPGSLRAAAYGGGRFVAVGDYNTILTSTDSLSWERSAVYSTDYYGYIKDIAYGAGRFVAAGGYGFQVSTDGQQWAAIDPNLYYNVSRVVYAGSQFVAVGYSGSIYTSPDGMAWTARTSWTSNSLADVSYGGGTYVAVGYGTVLTSPDAVTWTVVTGLPAGFYSSTVCYGGAPGSEQFVAISSSSSNSVYTSPDGAHWTLHTVSLSAMLYRVIYQDGNFIGVGSNGTVALSADGLTWTTCPSATTQTLAGVSYGGGTYIAVGSSGTLLTSGDSKAWTNTFVNATTANLNDGAWSGTALVAVGDGGKILRSSDGSSWETEDSGTTKDLMGAAYGAGTFVVGGFNGTVLTSGDGLLWTAQNPGVNNHFLGVSYCNGGFLAVGNAGMIARSANGETWSACVSNTTSDLYGVAYGAGTYVAVGQNNTVVTSPDGSTWTARTITGYGNLSRVIFAGGRFVAAGYGLYTSLDGQAWTNQSYYSLTGVTYLSGIYVAVGSGGYTMTSLDAGTWQYCDGSGNFPLNGVIPAGPVFMAVGDSGLIALSAPLPVISGIVPATGSISGGTSVGISGGGFTGATAVSFGGLSATGVSVASDVHLTATTPAVPSAGAVSVIVSKPTGRSLPQQPARYTYYGPPTVSTLSPPTGPSTGNTSVTITGTNFTSASAVNFGGTSLSYFNFISDSQITCYSPSHASGQVDVTVTTPGGTSPTGTGSQYTYFPFPDIQNLSPVGGTSAGGTTVTITGTGFTGATDVKFGAVSAQSFTVNSDTTITAVTAAGTGQVSVVVTNPHGSNGTYQAYFTFCDPPTLTGMSPTTGPTGGGSQVVISGTNFSVPYGSLTVTFGGIQCNSAWSSGNTTIYAYPPTHSAGTVDVVVTTPGGMTATSVVSKYTYVAPVPVVSSTNPNSGPIAGGTGITLGGSGFTGASAVWFGATAATSFSVTTDGRIDAVSPAHAVGSVFVTVTTAGGTSATSASSNFTYIVPQPVVASISPTSGSVLGGAPVTVNGTGLAGALSLFFGATSVPFTIQGDTRIDTTSPAHDAGTVPVTVTTPGGTSAVTSSCQFTYSLNVPVVTAVTPSSGPTVGNTSVTITGRSFSGATHVFFGSTPAASFTVSGDSSIVAVSPSGVPGVVYVMVTAPGGISSISSACQFSYVAPIPTLAAASPAVGSTGGGTVVALRGSGFMANPSVKFDGIPATAATMLDSGTITAVTPAHPEGSVTIVVENSDGQSAALASGFRYAAPPLITSVTKKTNPFRLKIGGAGFQGNSVIRVNGVPVPQSVYKSGNVMQAKSGASLKALLPAGVAVQITVTNVDDGTSSVPFAFSR